MCRHFNKRPVKAVSILLTALLAASMLSGCGFSSSKQVVTETAAANYMAMGSDAGFAMKAEAMYDRAEAPAMWEEAEMDQAAMGGGSEGGAVTDAEMQQAAQARSDRKLIRNVNVDIQTETMDALTEDIRKKVAEYNGYIENSSVYGGDYYGNGGRNASYTVRIPADRLDAFLDTALTAGKITSRSENVEDITLRYTDLESRVKSLKVEQERLLDIMRTAEDVDAIIALESRLSEIRYELENIQSSLKVYDNQVTYSTVYIYINEVRQIIPSEKAGFGERLTTGFRSNFADLMDSLEDFALWFLISIPNFIVWIVGLVAVCLLLRIARRLFRKVFKWKLPKPDFRKKGRKIAKAEAEAAPSEMKNE